MSSLENPSSLQTLQGMSWQMKEQQVGTHLLIHSFTHSFLPSPHSHCVPSLPVTWEHRGVVCAAWTCLCRWTPLTTFVTTSCTVMSSDPVVIFIKTTLWFINHTNPRPCSDSLECPDGDSVLVRHEFCTKFIRTEHVYDVSLMYDGHGSCLVLQDTRSRISVYYKL